MSCILTVLSAVLTASVAAASTGVDAEEQHHPDSEDATVAASEFDAPSDAATLPPAKDWIDWNQVLRFDAGRADGQRDYASAEPCRVTPCVLTRDAAIRFEIGSSNRFEIAVRLLHENRVTVIDYFEKRGLRDYVLVERMFNRKRNKDVWSLTERLEDGEIDTLFVYGVDLQYHLKEGDLIVVDMYERDNPSNHRAYFFRFHKAGYRVRLDLALLIPINAVTYPAPNPPYEVSKLNAAASISLTKNQDPKARYLLIERILMAGAPTLFVGFLTRTLEEPSTAPKSQFDLFLGLGLTYFDFLFTAWGANVIQEPHSSGLYFGVHVGKAFKFIRELNDSSPRKWDDYLEREERRAVVEE